MQGIRGITSKDLRRDVQYVENSSRERLELNFRYTVHSRRTGPSSSTRSSLEPGIIMTSTQTRGQKQARSTRRWCFQIYFQQERASVTLSRYIDSVGYWSWRLPLDIRYSHHTTNCCCIVYMHYTRGGWDRARLMNQYHREERPQP